MRYRSFSLAFLILTGACPAVIDRHARSQTAPVGPRQQWADVLCEVEGGATITSLVPEGTHVSANQAIGKLDVSGLRDMTLNQQITIQQAEANDQTSRLVREVAAIAIKEHEALAKQQSDEASRLLEILESEVRLARSTLQDQRDKNASELLIQRAEIDLRRAEFALAHQKASTAIVAEFTNSRRERELRIAFEKAQAEELSSRARLALERSKLAKLERQIKQSKLVAPAAGVVVYARSNRPIEEGATVRERQAIVRIMLDGAPKPSPSK